MLANHLVDRTPEVQVDEIRLDPVENRFCRVRHTLRVCAEQLDANGTLLRSKIQHLSRVLVAVQYAIRRDKFGHQHVRALLLAKPAKDRVRYSRHRREVKRTRVVKPGKHRRGSTFSGQYSKLGVSTGAAGEGLDLAAFGRELEGFFDKQFAEQCTDSKLHKSHLSELARTPLPGEPSTNRLPAAPSRADPT